MRHKPVLLEETLKALDVRPGCTVVDGTLGSGGHAQSICERIRPQGRLIAIDQDPQAIQRCRELLKDCPEVSFHHDSYKNIRKILDELKIMTVDAVLLDLGLSAEQLAQAERGFSFEREGPLDMRMNPDTPRTAKDLLQTLSERELECLFRDYGEERHARRFAAAIVAERRHRVIETTSQLTAVVLRSLAGTPQKKSPQRPGWARRHPATRVFQALRIAVNDELGVLKEGLDAILPCLARGGRLAVISFHSLEDRIVKRRFQGWKREGRCRWVYPKPIMASRTEVACNPRARTAKLRAIEKI